MKAAQYLGITPWEAEEIPWRYILQAEAAQEAEKYEQDNRRNR